MFKIIFEKNINAKMKYFDIDQHFGGVIIIFKKKHQQKYLCLMINIKLVKFDKEQQKKGSSLLMMHRINIKASCLKIIVDFFSFFIQNIEQFIIIVYKYNMQSKINRQELIHIIQQTDMLEKLSPASLQQLCKVFKVQNLNTEISGLIKQLKAKMIDIFVQQSDGYMDYLHLPRFKNLAHDLSQKMFSMFKHVWNEYEKFKSREHSIAIKKTIDELTPNFSSLEDIESFHLKLFQLYKSSDLCPKKSSQINAVNDSKLQPKVVPRLQMDNFLFPHDHRNNNSNKNPMMMPQIQNIHLPGMLNLGNIPQNIYSIFPFSSPVNYPKIQANDNASYIIQNKNGNNNSNMFDYQRYAISPHLNPYFPNNQDINYYHEQKPLKQIKCQLVQSKKPEPKSPFTIDLSLAMNQFNIYKFIQCPCQGKMYDQDKKKFKCSQCQFQYHYACLKISYSNQSNTSNMICPLCILRKQTIYCRVQKQPIKFNWHLNEKGKQLKVQMTLQESYLIYQAKIKGFNCQIRFLKIDGSSTIKDKKHVSQFTNTNGFFNKTSRYTEITLPELNDSNRQAISLEILLKTEDQAAQYSTPKLYLFAVFLIKIRRIQDIINDIFSSQQYTDISFYNQHFEHNNTIQISLQGQQFARGQIAYPVRGYNCKHNEVFDLKNFLGFIQDLNNQTEEFNCPIEGCSCVFTNFKFDKLIYDAIKNFPEYHHKQPEGIIIQKTGQYMWINELKNDAYQQLHPLTGNINDLDNNLSQQKEDQQQMQDDQI